MGAPSSTGTVGHLRMEGREVFKHAVGMITDVVEDTFARAGMSVDDLDWFVPQQANKRIIDASAKKLPHSEEKVVITVQLQGNTSAASVPLRLPWPSGRGASSKATWCCSKPWAADSLGRGPAALVRPFGTRNVLLSYHAGTCP